MIQTRFEGAHHAPWNASIAYFDLTSAVFEVLHSCFSSVQMAVCWRPRSWGWPRWTWCQWSPPRCSIPWCRSPRSGQCRCCQSLMCLLQQSLPHWCHHLPHLPPSYSDCSLCSICLSRSFIMVGSLTRHQWLRTNCQTLFFICFENLTFSLNRFLLSNRPDLNSSILSTRENGIEIRMNWWDCTLSIHTEHTF